LLPKSGRALFDRIEQCRRSATRAKKRAANFLTVVKVAAYRL
jgi:transposase